MTNAELTRRFWHVFEPIHAVVYFDLGPTDALKGLGTKGFWMSYFAGRFGPLGAVGPDAVTAMAFGFAPQMVARAVPDVWSYVDPREATEAWAGAAGDVLRDRLRAGEADVVRLAARFEEAVAGCRTDGRPLAAAWAAVDPGDDVYRRLWVHATVLREHRGDGHVLAAVVRGLSGLETGVTHVASGAVPRETIQSNRGWTDDEWDGAVAGLVARGLLDGDGRLTEAGRRLRREIEDDTDRLAAQPPEGAIELGLPLARTILDDDVVPQPNPIGISRDRG